MNGRSKHLPADERRAATVEAVVDLAAEQNPSDITTTAIAQRMGLTQGALFRHFQSKDAILEPVPKGLSDWGTRDSKGLFRPSWSERCGPQPLAGSIVARDFDMKRI